MEVTTTATTRRSTARWLPRSTRRRRLLLAILGGSLAIRLVGLAHGLPFAFNSDEEGHFVPPAAQAADGDLNPNYFDNPSALTYLLAVVFRLVFFGRDTTDLLLEDPGSLFLVARLVVAALGTLVVYLSFLAGREFFGERVGLCASALMGAAFLPVFYSHQALNDVPTLIGICLALVFLGRYLGDGTPDRPRLQRRDLWYAGAAVGLAAGTKYLAAPAALLVAAAVLVAIGRGQLRWRAGVGLLVGAGVACVGTLLALNPFLVLDGLEASRQFFNQSGDAGTGKLGQSGIGWIHYPVTLLWGFGVVPLVLAGIGVVLAAGRREERVRVLILMLFPVLLYLYMGGQGRFFARWMLPVYPMLAILAGYGAIRLCDELRSRLAATTPDRRWTAAVAAPALAALVLAQPLFDSVRSDVLLTRTDTRTTAHAWIEEHLTGQRLVAEPSLPETYLDGTDVTAWPIERPFQTYEERLQPTLIDDYRLSGYCWVMINSHQHDRGRAAGLLPARRYYARLRRESTRMASWSPYRPGAPAPPFSFDFSFNYYPLAYQRPGPSIEIRRLEACGPQPS